MAQEVWAVRNLAAARGSKAQGFLQVPGTGVCMPVTLIHGREEGRTLVVTAGLHSGEYPGVAAAVALAEQLNPEEVRGRLALVHCINTPGFFVRSDGLVPDDGQNLNQIFPGNPQGTTAQRMAAFLTEHFLKQADFLVDLHSGGVYESLTDCLFYPVGAGERLRDEALAAVEALDIPYAIASTAATGEYSYAISSLGVPALLLERGGTGLCRREKILGYCRDIRGLMHHLGMLEEEPAPRTTALRYALHTVYLPSPLRGLWYPCIEAGQTVEKGEKLGEIRDFFGHVLQEFFAETGGVVFYHLSSLAVEVGNNLAAYGPVEEKPY